MCYFAIGLCLEIIDVEDNKFNKILSLDILIHRELSYKDKTAYKDHTEDRFYIKFEPLSPLLCL